MFETIVALATPPMKSALSLIRVSGEDSFEVVSKCFSKDITTIDKRTALVGEIVNNDKIIDQVVIVAYKGPKSFTGEDLVEIICHGSMLIVNEIIEALLSKGARLAERGEYSMRAFLNQKIDLIQAEAINDVINATTKEAKDLSLLALEGKTSTLVEPLRKKLADIISLIEVNIDYPEYQDIEIANKEKIIKCADEIIALVDSLIEDGEKGRIIKDGIKVAIVGKPNVGKSSLLNALVGEEKAIVTDIKGTTRDVVEGDINLKGILLHLLDTAGIRESNDKIESIGINKSIKAINDAELVIVVLDASEELTAEDKEILELSKNKKRIVVYNKSDLLSDKDSDNLYISAQENDIDALTNKIKELLGIEDSDFSHPSLNNARQIGLLKQIKESMLQAKSDSEQDLSIDLVSVSLMDAYRSTMEILGLASDIDISKEIFSRFCVGK